MEDKRRVNAVDMDYLNGRRSKMERISNEAIREIMAKTARERIEMKRFKWF